jgi:hypothetical protein
MLMLDGGGNRRSTTCEVKIDGEPCGKPTRFRIKNVAGQVFSVCAQCYDEWTGFGDFTDAD